MISIFWGASGSGLNAELGPLSLGEGSTPGSGTITELGALSSDSTPNTHTIYSVHYYVSVNSGEEQGKLRTGYTRYVENELCHPNWKLHANESKSFACDTEVERVQKYSTQVKLPNY